jgi:hypothetical protein
MKAIGAGSLTKHGGMSVRVAAVVGMSVRLTLAVAVPTGVWVAVGEMRCMAAVAAGGTVGSG